jgi:outer membrane protein OmpA-like peptidoglycan-associated protein
MGDVINTEFQETTPHISPDRRFLYFSSNRPGGPGGNDIYVSERLDYTWLKWSKPVLLKGEINSPSDDSQPSFTPGNNYMYFTSRRDGSSDLFRVRLTPKPKLKKPIYIKGSIVNSQTGQLIRSELLWGPQSAKAYLEFFNSYNGQFEALLTDYEPYKFLPRKPGHHGQNIMVDPRIIERSGKDTVEIILYLDPKQLQDASANDRSKEASEVITSSSSGSSESPPDPERKVFVYDINFVKSKPIILTKSANALKQLLFMMESNPGMQILVEGHTDNVGDEKDLIDLSYQRAAAIRDYLVLNGIATDRIRVEGLGATRPIHLNLTEAGREKNRRVEITIIKN